jgi:hypothetical protein
MLLWIYPLEAFAKFCTGKRERMVRMAMLEMIELALRFVVLFVFPVDTPLDDMTLEICYIKAVAVADLPH